jgi:glutamine phosphoribosylpyrophosphate amidotransferase
MCGIIAACIKNATEEDLKLTSNLLLQSQIRGKHATGVAYYDGSRVEKFIDSLSAKDFLSKYDINYCISDDGNLYLIGHTRYSTSDLMYNQPILDSGIAVVHNGVITQESSDKWLEHFGYKCNTKNDSELILRAIEVLDHPLEKFTEASIASCYIDDDHISFYRNGLRPLYYAQFDRGVFVSSTLDILKRANIPGIIHRTEMNQIYYIDEFKVKLAGKVATNKQDLQNV